MMYLRSVMSWTMPFAIGIPLGWALGSLIVAWAVP